MASTTTVTAAPRLAPRQRVSGLWSRVIHLYMRLVFGKVMSVVRIMYARIPGMVLGQMLLERLSQKLTLDPYIRHLIELRICQQNSCGFCADLSGAAMILWGGAHDLPPEEISADPSDPRFDARTRAVLHYVDELGRDHTVSEATFGELLAHFSDTQAAEIVWLCAFTHYHNLMAKPLGLSSEGFCELARARRPQRSAPPTEARARPTS